MTFRKILFWSHLVIGLAAGLVIASMAVTGLMMAFEPQILAFAARGISVVEAPAGATPLPVSELLAKLAETESKTPSSVMVQSSSTASVGFGYGRERTVYLDPYTGRVLGENPKQPAAFFHSVEGFHRWLALTGSSKDVGKNITGAATLVFFLLLLSGLYLWWPRGISWKAAVTFRRGARGKARDWNWHTVTGFWVAPLILITTVTGLIMAYPWANNLLYTVTHTTPPAGREGRPMRDEGSTAAPAEDVTPADPDLLLAAAEKQSPGWRRITLNLPRPGAAHATANIEEAGTLLPHTRSNLVLDAATGEVVKWEPFSAQNSGSKLRAGVKFLHTGEIAGLPGACLVTVTALSSLFLVWTGFSLAWRRFFLSSSR